MSILKQIAAVCGLLAASIVLPTSAFAQVSGVTAGTSGGKGVILAAGTTNVFLPKGFNSVGLLYPKEYEAMMCGNMSADIKSKMQAVRASWDNNAANQLSAMKSIWTANTVRFQVSEGALSYENAHGLTAYTNFVVNKVKAASAAGLVTIVSMQWQGLGCSGINFKPTPDGNTRAAWAQIAGKFGTDKRIVLEVMNEPDTSDWNVWLNSGTPGGQNGMLPVATYIRSLSGSSHMLLVDGRNKSWSLAGIPCPCGFPANTAFSVHNYSPGNNASLDGAFGNWQQAGHSVIMTEWNEVLFCSSSVPNHDNLVQSYLPNHNIGLMIHSWEAPNANLASLTNFQPVGSIPGGCDHTGANMANTQFHSQP